jgi:hypothetical protein
MKRVAPIVISAALFVVLNFLFTISARADCSADIQVVRTQATAVKDDQRRQELQKLVDKAEKDDKAGRATLCDQAVQRARLLLK